MLLLVDSSIRSSDRKQLMPIEQHLYCLSWAIILFFLFSLDVQSTAALDADLETQRQNMFVKAIKLLAKKLRVKREISSEQENKVSWKKKKKGWTQYLLSESGTYRAFLIHDNQSSVSQHIWEQQYLLSNYFTVTMYFRIGTRPSALRSSCLRKSSELNSLLFSHQSVGKTNCVFMNRSNSVIFKAILIFSSVWLGNQTSNRGSGVQDGRGIQTEICWTQGETETRREGKDYHEKLLVNSCHLNGHTQEIINTLKSPCSIINSTTGKYCLVALIWMVTL